MAVGFFSSPPNKSLKSSAISSAKSFARRPILPSNSVFKCSPIFSMSGIDPPLPLSSEPMFFSNSSRILLISSSVGCGISPNIPFICSVNASSGGSLPVPSFILSKKSVIPPIVSFILSFNTDSSIPSKIFIESPNDVLSCKFPTTVNIISCKYRHKTFLDCSLKSDVLNNSLKSKFGTIHSGSSPSNISAF